MIRKYLYALFDKLSIDYRLDYSDHQMEDSISDNQHLKELNNRSSVHNFKTGLTLCQLDTVAKLCKQSEPRSGPTICDNLSGLIWIKTDQL